MNTRHMAIQALPALIAGLISFAIYSAVGHTPLMRALGMAITIGGIALTLQRFGGVLSVIGSFALAFSPAFWSQTGGEETRQVVLFSLALLAALVIIGILIWSKRFPDKILILILTVFALLFLPVIGSPRSLRVTILLTTLMLYVLIDLLMISNPRPDYLPQSVFPANHILTMVVMLLIGVLNDPLFILLAPAFLVGLHLAKVTLTKWYWGVILLIIAWGVYGTIVQYIASGWWLVPAETAEAAGIRVPFVIADGWREASRWVYLINLVRNQFTDIGILLGIIGLARLARWYPSLGVTTLVAYGTYALFGLVYFGKDSTILLLPLLMIHVLWMTYAIFALGQWLQKSFTHRNGAQWLATAAFILLPLALLGRVTGVL